MANIVISNGVKIIQTTEYVEINGERIILPKHVKNSQKKTIIVKNGRVTVNGYNLDLTKKTFNKKKWYDWFTKFF